MLNFKNEELNDEMIVDGNIDYNEELFRLTQLRSHDYQAYRVGILKCLENGASFNYEKDGKSILEHIISNITEIPTSRSKELGCYQTLNCLFNLSRLAQEDNIQYVNDDLRSIINAFKEQINKSIELGHYEIINYKDGLKIIAAIECLYDALHQDNDVYLKGLLKMGVIFTSQHKTFAKERCKEVLRIQNKLNKAIFDSSTDKFDQIKNTTIDEAKLAIRNGAQINGIFKGHLVFYELLHNKNVEVAKLLMGYEGICPYLGDGDSYNALDEAIYMSDLEMVTLLLNAGANPNWIGENGTAIHTALSLKGNKVEIMKKLIEAGADLNSRNEFKETLLHLAVKNDDKQTILQLLDLKVNLNLKNSEGCTPLHKALYFKNERVAKWLIEAGSDLSLTDNQGNAPAHIALINKMNLVFKKLINHGSDLNLQNNNGDTLLHIAINQGSSRTASDLIQSHASMDLQNKRGYTPLHSAIETGNIEVIKHLLERNAKLDICNCDGDTPFHLAIKKSKQPIINIFLENIAAINLNARNNNGDTVLHTAIRESNNLAVQKLLECNIDLNTTNDEGQTPLMLAQSMNLFAISELIKRASATRDLLNPVLSR